MSTDNAKLSSLFPLRPLVPPPIPDDDLTISVENLQQFAGLYPFEFTPTVNNLDYYTNQNITPHFKLILSDVDNGNEVDVSAFVTNWGSITRSVDYLLGKMSPSSHSFQLANTKDSGEFLFTLRKNLGLEYWMGKEYNLYVGFYEGLEIEWFNVYTGKITVKSEDRIKGTVKVNSHDIIKELNDFKTCGVIKGSDVFDYDGDTDIRSVQQEIKYGTHELNTNQDKKELTKRDKPFTATEAVYNLYNNSSPKSDATLFDKHYLWYVPIINNQDLSLYDSGDLKIYYWDYTSEKKKWKLFETSDFVTDIIVDYSTGSDIPNGFYIQLHTPAMIMNLDGIGYDNLEDYVDSENGTATDDFDPAIMVETFSEVSNPVKILKDLMISSKYISYDDEILDYNSFSSPDIFNYTWDKAFESFNNENAKINVAYNKEVSLMNVINEICLICGLKFFASRKKSLILDRRIKLIENSPLNPVVYPLRQDQLILSTKDASISSLILSTDNSKQVNKVTVFDFDIATSTKDNFNTYIIEKTLEANEFLKQFTFGSSGSKVYFYNSSETASAVAQRYYYELLEPPEIMKLSCNKAGFMVEVGDLVDIHDAMSNETNTTQVYRVSLDVKSAAVKLETKRFSTQLGPDPEAPCKLWMFADYFYATDSDCADGDGWEGHSYYAY